MNPLKLIKKKLITRGTVLKTPALGRCPKCGSPLHLANSSLGKFVVCSNPLCDFYEKAKE